MHIQIIILYICNQFCSVPTIVTFSQVENINLDATYAVAQYGESLRYKPEGRGFDSRWGSLKFSI